MLSPLKKSGEHGISLAPCRRSSAMSRLMADTRMSQQLILDLISPHPPPENFEGLGVLPNKSWLLFMCLDYKQNVRASNRGVTFLQYSSVSYFGSDLGALLARWLIINSSPNLLWAPKFNFNRSGLKLKPVRVEEYFS